MFFDIGWPEFLLVGIVALVVIGPKDLPRAMRVAGFWLRKARTLSREFQNSVDQMIREAELDEVRQELHEATSLDVAGELHRTIDPDGSLAESIRAPAYPDYFAEAEGPAGPGLDGDRQALPPPAGEIAPAAPIPQEMPRPEFIGFAADEPEFIGFEDEAEPPDPAFAPRAAEPVKP
jgi:sec-independent protein translocase protein TatB